MRKDSLRRLLRSWTSALLGTSALLMPLASQAETVLEYVGPLLKRFGGDFDPPPEVTFVRAVIVLHDGVKTRGASLAGHSRESHEGKIFKRAEITVGSNTYKFLLPDGHSGDLNLTFDAAGNVTDWQIRYFGHFDDIALYGPGSIRPGGSPNEPDVPPTSSCLHADVVASRDRVVRRSGEPPRNYRAIGCGAGRWTGDGPLTDFALLQATTKDSNSVTVRYRASSLAQDERIMLRAFRASNRQRTERYVELGSVELSSAELLADGSAQELRLFKGVPLIVLPELPYVVVEAVTSRGVSAAAFRRHSFAVVAHGFTFGWRPSTYTTLESLFGDGATAIISAARDPFNSLMSFYTGLPPSTQSMVNDEVFKGYEGLSLVADWVDEMEQSLTTRACVNSVIKLDWVIESATAEPFRTKFAAQKALALMESRAKLMVDSASGDVVDWWLIGHSRGGAVVSELLKLLERGRFPVGAGLVRATLLDPHPANNWAKGKLMANMAPFQLDPIGLASAFAVARFQSQALDPDISFPENAGLYLIDYWYQRNPEIWAVADRMNLWGRTPDQIDFDKSGATRNDFDLTGKKFVFVCTNPQGDKCPDLEKLAYHGTVPIVFKQLVLDSGPKRRCPP